jgi:branched-chain amino acid transport system ATP-binding protein
MEALRVEGLSKIFGGVHALEEVSFNVEIGERLAIIGPNGAGKTTLFNVLNGQVPATSGKVFFFGKEISAMATHRRALLGQARTFQLISLFQNLTVLDNVLLALHGTRPSRFQMFRSADSYENLLTRAQDLLGLMGLWENRDFAVGELSYGEQRKMELSLSIASEPRMLLLDEPGNGLTADETAALIDRIRNLDSDITVLIVAHDMDLVFGVAERIIVLHYGQVIAEGTPEEIRTDLKVKEIYMGAEDRRRI